MSGDVRVGGVHETAQDLGRLFELGGRRIVAEVEPSVPRGEDLLDGGLLVEPSAKHT